MGLLPNPRKGPIRFPTVWRRPISAAGDSRSLAADSRQGIRLALRELFYPRSSLRSLLIGAHLAPEGWGLLSHWWSNIQTMKSLPLNALQAFALAVSKGGVRAAARELSVSHSAVSRHLNEVERRLGVSLYERDNAAHKFSVTPQGQRLAATVLSALNDVRTAIGAISEQKSRHAVTVSTAPSFAARWLLPRLPALERAYPHLETSILVDQRLDDLRASEADFAIRMGRGTWPDVTATPFMDDL